MLKPLSLHGDRRSTDYSDRWWYRTYSINESDYMYTITNLFENNDESY
jgi:hypothetical protein